MQDGWFVTGYRQFPGFLRFRFLASGANRCALICGAILWLPIALQFRKLKKPCAGRILKYLQVLLKDVFVNLLYVLKQICKQLYNLKILLLKPMY